MDLTRFFDQNIGGLNHRPNHKLTPSTQWPFQDPRLEVPTIYKAYIRP